MFKSKKIKLVLYDYFKNIDIKTQKLLSELWHLVGNTPMLELEYKYKGRLGHIYVKCEHYNLTGSVKDRMALYILTKAYQRGEINPGDTIIEATSGNTGIALASIGRALGHPITRRHID